jgi:hypothetical protein
MPKRRLKISTLGLEFCITANNDVVLLLERNCGRRGWNYPCDVIYPDRLVAYEHSSEHNSGSRNRLEDQGSTAATPFLQWLAT